MQDARAMLEALMGPNRNQTAKEQQKERKSDKPEFAERNICKRYLVAFCPHDWFTVQKRQLEPCTKVHSDYYKRMFEEHPDVEKYRAEYEDEFLTYLEKVVADCEKLIARERTRCREKGAGGKRVILPTSEVERVKEMEGRYAKLIAEAEEKAEQSGVQRAGELTEQAQAVKDLIDAVKARHTHEFPGEDVCEVCGIRYALEASAASELHGYEPHLNGKLHLGYTKIRSTVFELREKKRKRDTEQLKKEEQQREEREKDKEQGRDQSGGREKARDRDRDRERRDRDREKDKGRKEEKDDRRGRERSGSKAKARASGRRSRSRSRGRRKKSASRSRSKDGRRAGAKAKKSTSKRSRSRSKDRGKGKSKEKQAKGSSQSRSRSRSRRAKRPAKGGAKADKRRRARSSSSS